MSNPPDIPSSLELDVDRNVYGAAATKLVSDRYQAIKNELEAAKKRGVVPRGVLLNEVLNSSAWRRPVLLDADRFDQFRLALADFDLEGALRAVWYILENVCGERRLTPVLRIDPKEGRLYVDLAL